MIDRDRLFRRFLELGAITEPDRPWTRRSFTPRFDEGRAYLRRQMEAAGLRVRIDEAGNLIGRLEGTRPDLGPILTGSHSDTVPEGGRFDGIAGVLCGIEVAAALAEAGETLRHPLEVVDFLAEEPSEFGLSCIGSRGMTGALDAAMLALTHPSSGETLAEAIRRLGGDPARLRPEGRADRPAACVELHIEQGPVLEREGLDIGIVTAIVGILRIEVSVQGQPDHAGTTPMDARRDALAGAARLVTWTRERAAAGEGDGAYLVATVGRLSVAPNAPNIVPARVDFVIDLRSDRRAVMDGFATALQAALPDLLGPLGLTAQMRVLSDSEPTRMDAGVRQAVATACRRLGLGHRAMPSGAGHDAAFLAGLCPTGMIFVPCLGGRSHCPEEWATPDQLHAGAAVLLETIRQLDGEGA